MNHTNRMGSTVGYIDVSIFVDYYTIGCSECGIRSNPIGTP